jgi:hypothetical protein
MFEKSLQTILRNDPVLAGYVGTFGADSSPSIFSEFAPEGAAFPYIVFKISYRSDNDVAIHRFTVDIDYYDMQKSAADSRNAATRIMFLLDHTKIDSDRYGAIRLFFFGGGSVIEDDPRAIHYNMEFDARAGRKAWADSNNTTTEP